MRGTFFLSWEMPIRQYKPTYQLHKYKDESGKWHILFKVACLGLGFGFKLFP